MDTSILLQELEPLNSQIDQLESAIETLEGELRIVETEFEAFAVKQQQFERLKAACDALENLQEQGVGNLFWGGLLEAADQAKHSERLRARIAEFEEKPRGINARRESLQAKIDQHLIDLDNLFYEVQQAYVRDEIRLEEFTLEREISELPYRPMIMPWTKDAESEKRFHRTMLIALFWCMMFSIAIPLITVPIPDRNSIEYEIPERVAMLVKKKMPIPVPEITQKQVTPEKKTAKSKEPVKSKKSPEKKLAETKPTGGATKKAKEKVASVGVLAFKSSFSDLMDEVPVAKLGTEARVKNVKKRVPGQARVKRSLVARQAQGGSSEGIRNYEISRNLDDGGTGDSGYGNAGEIGGVGTAKISSSMAGLTEEAGRRLSDGLGAARTDEEIQIVFDRYKATLYRIYNKELRKDPTLRGKLLLRLTIEPGGEVSMCEVESSDLDSPALMTKIVDRVKRFNFGPKEGVTKITILYPIDFLPSG